MIRCAALSLIACLGAARILDAQSVSGTVTDDARRALQGVVVTLLDSTSATIARQLSNEAGAFRLAPAQPGNYRIQTRRIGYLPSMSEVFPLRAGENAMRHITLVRLKVSLDTVRVMAQSACAVTDSTSITFTLWDQLRAALAATSATADDSLNETRILSYTRTLDPRSFDMLGEDAVFRTARGQQPWTSLSADSLRKAGYVESLPKTGTLFHAPNLDVLLSNEFLADHCIRFATDSGRTGIAFEPTRARRRIPEIKGTLWFDRTNVELRSMEFQYVNVRSEQDGAGGTMTFSKLQNGMWLIARWEIHMPEFPRDIRVRGGDLILSRRGDDTLWTTPPIIVLGTALADGTLAPLSGVTVSVHGQGMSSTSDERGYFMFTGLLPDDYMLDVHSAALDAAGIEKHYTLKLKRFIPIEIHLPVPVAAEPRTAP